MKQRLKEKQKKINKTKNWFLEKLNKIASAILIKKKKDRVQLESEMEVETLQPTPQKYKGA